MTERTKADAALLKRFEPIIRFTKGETFFPMDVEPYIGECSLWMQKPNDVPICLVPNGALTVEKLLEPRPDDFETVYFMRFIEDEDLHKLGVSTFRGNVAKKEGFRPGRGRLARVGYSSRFIDALFAITLFARGRVPGDTAIGAYLAYQGLMKTHEHYSYYGRVVRQDGWIVLQYWFFYAFNSWRSGFSGVNDHESDWEMVCIYLYQTDYGEVKPEWVAYASHDFHGDDLRRRWDDPELEKMGEHPVIYAGAGSHASYFQKGEYMTQVELPFLTPLVRFVDQQRLFWRKLLRQYQPEELQQAHDSEFNLFRIPFIDYARGDGLSIGPAQDKQWAEPRLLDPIPDWALHYRGLWGLYTKDPVSGEDAPGGPLYNRNGSIRTAWYDPVSWAGLSKVPPPNQALERTQTRRSEIAAEQEKLAQEISRKRDRLTGLTVEAEAIDGLPHLKRLHEAHEEAISSLFDELVTLREQHAADEVLLTTLDQQLVRLERGERGPMRAHIHHAHSPISDDELDFGRIAELWASASMGVMMIAFVGLIIFAPDQIVLGTLILLGGMIVIEAAFRKRLQQLVTGVTNFLAVVASLVLLYQFALLILSVVVLLMGGYILWQNLKEYR